MIRLTGFALLLLIFAVDVASAQTFRYVDRANPGASQLSNHQFFVGSQRRAQNQNFSHQRNASARQRMSMLSLRRMQRSAGQRGNSTGAAAEVVAQKREQARNRIVTRRTMMTRNPTTTRIDAATAQREKARRQAAQRGSKRKSRTLAW